MKRTTPSDSCSYMHFPVGDGYVTAAIRRAPCHSTCRVGLAFCSPKDQFSRKRGRQIAEGRLNAGKSVMLPLESERQVKRQVLSQLLDRPELFPQWAVF